MSHGVPVWDAHAPRATPSASQQHSLNAIAREELEAADWLVIEDIDQCQDISSRIHGPVEASTRRDVATTLPDVPGYIGTNTTLCHPQGCMVASWTALWAARSRSRFERERLHECHHVQQYNIQRYIESTFDRGSVAEFRHGLQQQMSTDRAIVAEQAAVMEAADRVVCELEVKLSHLEMEDDTGTSIPDVPVSDSCRAPPLVDSYLRRCGDASIARERLAELAYEASSSGVDHERPHREAIQLCESYIAQEMVTRKASLELDLRCALRDVEALKAACVARNLDPELCRFR